MKYLHVDGFLIILGLKMSKEDGDRPEASQTFY